MSGADALAAELFQCDMDDMDKKLAGCLEGGGALGTLARLTVAGSVSSKRSSLGRSLTPASLQGSQGGQAENLAQDMADLMHDFDTVSR